MVCVDCGSKEIQISLIPSDYNITEYETYCLDCKSKNIEIEKEEKDD